MCRLFLQYIRITNQQFLILNVADSVQEKANNDEHHETKSGRNNLEEWLI